MLSLIPLMIDKMYISGMGKFCYSGSFTIITVYKPIQNSFQMMIILPVIKCKSTQL